METLRLLYPVELTAILYVSLMVASSIGGSVWKKRAKARGNYSKEAEQYFLGALGMSMIFLLFSLDVMMYRLGADLSSERLDTIIRIFFTGVAWSIYFGFIVPKVFRFDYARLSPENSSLQNNLWGVLIFGLAVIGTFFLWVFSGTIVLCVFNLTWLSKVYSENNLAWKICYQ